ncbi:MAG: UV DNA damage repair endonuclease UvsE [Candidatus Bilamarchaeaceae archaeon]
MKIGYPCINTSIGCTANSTFRLKNYSEENMVEKINNNLNCLEKILNYNIEKGFLFFRISSDLVPFASHPICTFNWRGYFKKRFREIGKFIKENEIRISMHPDQFVLINATKKAIIDSSIAELKWHCDVLDLMNLDNSAKVQIHVGGVYGDKESAISRFIQNYKALSHNIKKRLVIENDDRNFSLRDCLKISENVGVPVLFDSFHHECLNNGEKVCDAIKLASETWKNEDGILMVDYSSQEPNQRVGKHAEHIDLNHFKNFLNSTKRFDFDIMLEIKDKETSAIEAIQVLKKLNIDKKKRTNY